MSGWLVDTLFATGALLALVLLVRRPAARLFGPGLAYALWLVPVARMVLPPLTLPAGMSTPVAAPGSGAVAVMIDAGAVVAGVPDHPGWTQALWALWLGGAALFLVWRLAGYFIMRRRLLAQARLVGAEGRVRLVESPLAGAPVAFGVFDKVVALPIGFMARADVAGRDLAIAHELAHHAGHDLAVNFAVQPLLALHWFNPLAWLAWRALLRDQEAACDARVMAGRDATARAAYGRLIASFAAGPRLALAAPMACPVIGEKSVIHRLRSLTMSQPSPRRRLTGRSVIAAALLALPLTATISHAEGDPAPAPAPAPHVEKHVVIVEKDGAAAPGDATLYTRTIERDGRTIVLRTTKPLTDAEAEDHIARAFASMPPAPPAPVAAAAAPVPPVPPAPAAAPEHRERRVMIVTSDSNGPTVTAGGLNGEAMTCADGAEQVRADASEDKGDGHRQTVRIRTCVAGGDKAAAIDGIRRAKERIAADGNMSPSIKAQVLQQLDAEIERLSNQG